ncbi:MAG TPA: hypothetical protein PKC34_08615 [Pseudomonadales bacterium]|jgi:hypothetical protein|nr:hypothetical protein [Pseudomonadales bacterium]HMW15592.1 hypothetical protein [Pseudomonadales bacterium]HMW83668.1 hypothetical protein [Pseudomonadales bacterium]HNB84477.1 hypothetical protein [Pseudomonadales bacterium]HNC77495.1 hypothetical protein [Pseudomonadales bacterium]
MTQALHKAKKLAGVEPCKPFGTQEQTIQRLGQWHEVGHLPAF